MSQTNQLLLALSLITFLADAYLALRSHGVLRILLVSCSTASATAFILAYVAHVTPATVLLISSMLVSITVTYYIENASLRETDD